MTLRVGFASAVRHAHDYLRILGGDERVRVVAVAEEAGAAKWARADSRAAAQAAGVPFFDDLDAVLDAAAVDLVVVCSEPTRHARLALRALAAGVEVLVDKPVATTLADADAVLERPAARAATSPSSTEVGS